MVRGGEVGSPIIIREKGKELCAETKMAKKSYVVVAGDTEPCPRCGRPMQIREHAAITERHLAQPYYYTRWFNCTAAGCKTTLVMRERFKVTRGADPEFRGKPVILDDAAVPWE